MRTTYDIAHSTWASARYAAADLRQQPTAH